MCNAWNHNPDCDCGFGPPYRWEVYPAPPESWYERSLVDRETYEHHLRDLGFSQTEIVKEMNRYRRHNFPLSKKTWDSLSAEEKVDWKTRFLVFLRIYRFEEVQDKEVTIDIPIFKLHSPNVKKSKVTYELAELHKEAVSWSVKVLGFGTGNSQVFLLKQTSEFPSMAGECKLVRLPVTLRLTCLKLYRRDKFLRSVLKVEPSPKHENQVMHEGAKQQQRAACLPDRSSIIGPSHIYPLAEDSPRTLSKYSKKWVSETEKHFTTGVEAFNLKGLCQATVRRERTITLTFELPGGHDYHMFQLKEPDGLVWEAVRK